MSETEKRPDPTLMRSTDPQSRRPRLQAIARWALGVCASFVTLYLVGMNVFLGTHVFRSLISFDPDSFRLEYARAYSLLPGRIHVEGLAIRGRDSNVEWILRLDRCDFHVSFFDLTRRKFHASRVRGHGLSFRIRLRVAGASAEHLAALPPVPGFSDPPYQDLGPPSPPLTDAKYKLWSVQLDDVDADPVRELWIDTFRSTGDLRVRGRWLFRPMRWLDVGPAVVDARALDVAYGMNPLLTGAQGVIHVTVHPYDVRVPEGLEILDQVSASASLRGHLRMAEALRTFARDKVDFTRGEGPLDLVVALDHGVLTPPTYMALESEETRARVADAAIVGSMRATFEVKPVDPGPPTGVARVEASSVDLERDNHARAHASAAVGTLTSRELKLSHAFGDATFQVDVRDAETQSLQPWLPPSPQLEVQSGRVTATAEAEGTVSPLRAKGTLSFAVEHLAVARGDDRVWMSMSGAIAVKDASPQEKMFALGESHVTLASPVARSHGMTMSAASVTLKGEGTVSVPKTTVSGQALLQDIEIRPAHGDLRAPSVALTAEALSPGDGPRGWGGRVGIDVARADIGDLAAFARDFSLPADITLDRGAASAAMHLAVDLGSRTATGSIAFDARDVACHLASKALTGRLSLRIQAERRGDLTDLSGTTLAFDSANPQAERDPSGDGWWARAELRQTALRATDALAFHGHLHLTALDGSPIAAMVASQTPIPPFVLAAVPFHDLVADGDVRAARSSLEVRSFHAQGGSDRVELEYNAQSQNTEWALLVEAGPLGTGFHMQRGHVEFTLVDARPWYDAKVAGLRASNEPFRE